MKTYGFVKFCDGEHFDDLYLAPRDPFSERAMLDLFCGISLNPAQRVSIDLQSRYAWGHPLDVALDYVVHFNGDLRQFCAFFVALGGFDAFGEVLGQLALHTAEELALPPEVRRLVDALGCDADYSIEASLECLTNGPRYYDERIQTGVYALKSERTDDQTLLGLVPVGVAEVCAA